MRFPYAEVEFESSGALHDPAQRTAALELVRSSDATDVLVLAHGWNNDLRAAKRLFVDLTDSIDAARAALPAAASRRLVVLGMLWPSVRWADEDQLAGGGVGLADERTALREAIAERIEDPAVAAELEQLVAELETSSTARDRYLALLREQLPDPPADDEEPPPSALVGGDTAFVFDQAAIPDVDLAGAGTAGPTEVGGGGAATGVQQPSAPDAHADATATEMGGAAGFGFGGVLRGARSLLNLTTYYTMKARAGDVGVHGVAPILAAVAAEAPGVRLHLAGHSFGARVVAAAVTSGDTAVHTLTLLQGAFSHHALARDYDGRGRDGLFRSILAPTSRVVGTVLVTHTPNDRAVGIAYAVASRLARQQASGLGGPGDLYGGIGRNGALCTPEVAEPAGRLDEVGASYGFGGGRVHNLESSRYISSHSAVTGREVGYALLAAMTSD
jgi:hypothetical protein